MARPSVRTRRGTDPLHGRILDLLQAVAEELRGGQHVAQLVVDLADREAEIGEAALLAQFVGEHPLHARQRLLGEADLVVALGRRDDPRGVLRVGREGGDVAGQPPHGPHDQPVQRQVDEARR